MTETAILKRVMLALSKAGAIVFRNNQGVAVYPGGARVVYGVAHPGGSDVVGWAPLMIGPEHVGRTVAVFLAVEVKTPEGRLTVDQQHFLTTVAKAGGIAIIARSPEEAIKALGYDPSVVSHGQ